MATFVIVLDTLDAMSCVLEDSVTVKCICEGEELQEFEVSGEIGYSHS